MKSIICIALLTLLVPSLSHGEERNSHDGNEYAAKSEKPELINFYFSEMNESCMACHSMFATHKFPALSPKGQKGEHKH